MSEMIIHTVFDPDLGEVVYHLIDPNDLEEGAELDDLFYAGEALSSLELPQSYTCPYCSRMGFTDVTIQEHVSTDHVDTSFEVVCPLCAAMPGGDPNLMTDDFAGHLTLEHRNGGPRDLISFLDEPVGTRHSVRRIPHNAAHMGRGAAALRPRRSNMHFSVFSSGGLSSLSPSSRETVDPIAELLSQLSGVRRSASNTNSSTPTQLQQLQMQLQLERQQVNAARQQLERFPRRQTQSQTSLRETHGASNSGSSTLMLNPSPVLIQQPSASAPSMPSPQSQYLLVGLLEELNQETTDDTMKQERSQFVTELVLSSIVKRNTGLSEAAAAASDASTQEDCGARIKNPFFQRAVGQRSSQQEMPADEPSSSRHVRQGNIVLRGRARSDAHNSRRRAEANRTSMEMTQSGESRSCVTDDDSDDS